jgi:DNA polymerase III epsilon subunit-like protein
MGNVDSSYAGSPGAYSVVYKNHKDGKLVWQSWFVDKMFHNNWGELAAIAEAVNMAVLRLRLAQAVKTTEIHIFTDSLESLDYLERDPSDVRRTTGGSIQYGLAMAPARSFIAKLSHELHHLGAHLTLSYIPGHGHDVAGHVIADAAAYNAYVSGAASLKRLKTGHGRASSAPRLSLKRIDKNCSRKSAEHGAIWSVLHGRSVDSLAAMKREVRDKATREEEVNVAQLKDLLELRGRNKLWAGMKRKLKELKRKVGHFL